MESARSASASGSNCFLGCEEQLSTWEMGRYRLLRALGGELVMTNLPESISKVMRLAGLEKLGRIEEREVTV